MIYKRTHIADNNKTHLNSETDFILNQVLWSFYFLVSLYILICITVVMYRTRDKLFGPDFWQQGPFTKYLCLLLCSSLILVKMWWFERNMMASWNGNWDTPKCCETWKRVQNVFTGFSEGFILLFGWLRGQLFYDNPIVKALFIPDSLLLQLYNKSLFVLTLLYPIAFTVYSVTPFWVHNHRNTYILEDNLCYSNYREPRPRRNKVPMVMTTFFQGYDVAVHIGVIVPLIYPFFLFLRESKEDKLRRIPVIMKIMKRSIIALTLIVVLHILAWGVSALLVPFMPMSKFLLETISDIKIAVGMIICCFSLDNWKEIILFWRTSWVCKNIRGTEMKSVIFTNTTAVDSNSAQSNIRVN